MMKNTTSVALATLLAIAVILGVVSFRQYRQAKADLRDSERKLSELNELVTRLRQEGSPMTSHVPKNMEASRKSPPGNTRTIQRGEPVRPALSSNKAVEREATAPRSDPTEQLKATMQSVISELGGEMAGKDAETEELLKKLEEAKSKILSLRADIAKRQTRLTAFQEQVSELQGKKVETETKANQLKGALKAVISEIGGDLKNKDAEADELVEYIEEAKSRIRSLREEIAERQEKLVRFEKELSSLQDQKLESQSKTGQLRSDFEAIVSDLNLQLRRKDSEITELLKHLELAQSKILSLKDDMATRQDRLLAFQRQLSKLEGREAEAETKADEFGSHFETLVAELSEQLQTKDREAAELVKYLEDAKSKILSLSHEIEERQSKLVEVQKQLTTIEAETVRTEARYKALISQLKEQIQNREMTIKRYQQELYLTFVDRVLFDFGQATLTPEGERILTKIGEALKDTQEKTVRVVGHTDDIPISSPRRGIFPSNWELSSARASAVVRFLQDDVGLDPRIMEAVGRSYYDPIASNATREGRAKNRRVEIIVAPRMSVR